MLSYTQRRIYHDIYSFEYGILGGILPWSVVHSQAFLHIAFLKIVCGWFSNNNQKLLHVGGWLGVQKYSICDVFEEVYLCLIKTVYYLTKFLHKIRIGKMSEELFSIFQIITELVQCGISLHTNIYLHRKFACLWVIVATSVTSLCNRVTIKSIIYDPYKSSYTELLLCKQISIYAENLWKTVNELSKNTKLLYELLSLW